MKGDELAAFLGDYGVRCREQGIQPIDSGLLRPILESFILDEPWLERGDPSKLEVTLRSLRVALSSHRRSAKLLNIVERESKRLGAKLERQVYANVILREQNVLLSDALHRLQNS